MEKIEKNTFSDKKIFKNQPILCPWITSKPFSINHRTPNAQEFESFSHYRDMKFTTPSIQQSSSQFFYFLRLMQLFPETHPATLHTVLNLTGNDFLSAVDKLLYAKKCKLLGQKRGLKEDISEGNGVNSKGNKNCNKKRNCDTKNVQFCENKPTKEECIDSENFQTNESFEENKTPENTVEDLSIIKVV